MSAIAQKTRLLSISALFVSALFFMSTANAAKVSGVTLNDSITVGGEDIPLRGAGLRKRLFIKLYVGSLYAADASASAADVIGADKAMAIRLNTLSDLLTRKKMASSNRPAHRCATG